MSCNCSTKENKTPPNVSDDLIPKMEMTSKSRGRASLDMNLFEANESFGTEESAQKWFREAMWGDGPIKCPHCDDGVGQRCKWKSMPYRCRDCRRYFSLKSGTFMANSNMGIHKWMMGFYLVLSHSKGISSLQLAKWLGISDKSSWRMLSKIRKVVESFGPPSALLREKVLQWDEAYFGGKERFKHAKDRIKGSQGGATKEMVGAFVGNESGLLWPEVIDVLNGETVKDTIEKYSMDEAVIYTDEGRQSMTAGRERHTVNHSEGEYVKAVIHQSGEEGMATTNHVESAWRYFRSVTGGVHHKVSPKHLRSYLRLSAWKWNNRFLGIEEQMKVIFKSEGNRKIGYKEIIKDNGRPSGSGPGGAYFPERRRRYACP